MKGTRRDFGDGELLDPGEYGKSLKSGDWYCHPPDTAWECFGNLSGHDVTEHEDGTITVAPSIAISTRENGKDVELWHGYLERGVWRKA